MHKMSEAGVRLEIVGLGKRYGGRWVFQGLSATLERGATLVVTGRNGAGKSTLLRLLAGLEQPTSGSISYVVGGRRLAPALARPTLGLITPELRLYRELTALEHLRLFADLRGLTRATSELLALLEQVGLPGRAHDRVAGYSSGMALRLKYAINLLHSPTVLLLDEPTATFDSQGRALVAALVATQRERGITIVATNEPRELALGDYLLPLDETGAAP
jgi:heme exporter protein A